LLSRLCHVVGSIKTPHTTSSFSSLSYSLSHTPSLERETARTHNTSYEKILLLIFSVSKQKMSHAVFHTAQFMPIKTLASKPKVGPFLPVVHPVADKMCRRGLVLRASASSSSVQVGWDSVSLLERCFAAPPAPGGSDSASAVMVAPVMKGQYGALGSVTLEKGKLDMSQKQSQSSPEVCSSFILFCFIYLFFSFC
jgi:hypothetical protein